MNTYKEISPYELTLPVCRAVGREWMLICASDGTRVNAMTASWGFLGEVWGAPAAVCFVRPSRFTFPLIDGSPCFSLCFFGGGRRRELSYFGSHSGRDGDKAAACGMSYGAVVLPDGKDGVAVPYIEGAQTVLVCRRLYSDDIKAGRLADAQTVAEYYSDGDIHRMFIGRIEKCLIRAKADG